VNAGISLRGDVGGDVAGLTGAVPRTIDIHAAVAHQRRPPVASTSGDGACLPSQPPMTFPIARWGGTCRTQSGGRELLNTLLHLGAATRSALQPRTHERIARATRRRTHRMHRHVGSLRPGAPRSLAGRGRPRGATRITPGLGLIVDHRGPGDEGVQRRRRRRRCCEVQRILQS